MQQPWYHLSSLSSTILSPSFKVTYFPADDHICRLSFFIGAHIFTLFVTILSDTNCTNISSPISILVLISAWIFSGKCALVIMFISLSGIGEFVNGMFEIHKKRFLLLLDLCFCELMMMFRFGLG